MIGALFAAAFALNSAVSQASIHQTICVAGWTRSVRPPVSYTSPIKRRLLPAGARMADYELDHWIPLALGGAPRDPRNLVLQPWPEAKRKDRLEDQLHRAVCSGRVTLKDARGRIAGWQP